MIRLVSGDWSYELHQEVLDVSMQSLITSSVNKGDLCDAGLPYANLAKYGLQVLVDNRIIINFPPERETRRLAYVDKDNRRFYEGDRVRMTQHHYHPNVDGWGRNLPGPASNTYVVRTYEGPIVYMPEYASCGILYDRPNQVKYFNTNYEKLELINDSHSRR